MTQSLSQRMAGRERAAISEALRIESVLGPIDEDINYLRRLLEQVIREYMEGQQVREDVVRRIEA